MAGESPQPPRNCPLCPCLVAFRHEQRAAHPDWFNAPVPAFGDPEAWLAVVGLAPGLRGANRTGRPFTGMEQGLCSTARWLNAGWPKDHDARSDDAPRLADAIIVNAVNCAPPQNKPTPEESAPAARSSKHGSKRCATCAWWWRSARSPTSRR